MTFSRLLNNAWETVVLVASICLHVFFCDSKKDIESSPNSSVCWLSPIQSSKHTANDAHKKRLDRFNYKLAASSRNLTSTEPKSPIWKFTLTYPASLTNLQQTHHPSKHPPMGQSFPTCHSNVERLKIRFHSQPSINPVDSPKCGFFKTTKNEEVSLFRDGFKIFTPLL